jgi:hypothetical protein
MKIEDAFFFLSCIPRRRQSRKMVIAVIAMLKSTTDLLTEVLSQLLHRLSEQQNVALELLSP